MEVDVRQEQSIRAVIEFASSRFGRLDIAVNNAGLETPLGPIHEATNEQFEQVMAVNVRGHVALTQARDPIHARAWWRLDR